MGQVDDPADGAALTRPIYLDNNATTCLDARVIEAMAPYWDREYANPASIHPAGHRAAERLEAARERIGEALGLDPAGLFFTSGGTESNNAAIRGCLPEKRCVATSTVEHPSVLQAASAWAERKRGEHCRLGLGGGGFVEAVPSGKADSTLVSVMWANNETGELLSPPSAPFLHVDAVQALGKVPLAEERLDRISALTLTAHKIHGPKGIGCLWVDPELPFRPLLHGGEQERGRRPGTVPLPLVVGFETAVRLACHHLDDMENRVRGLRDRLEEVLKEEIPSLEIVGAGSPRLPNTSCVTVAGIDARLAIRLLGEEGILCSSGSACSSGTNKPSHVLAQKNLSEDRIRGALRFSLSRMTTEEELERALPVIGRTLARLKKMV